jgi:putative flavoprotein involved in K+ transport
VSAPAERFDAIVIGGGQAGLAAGYFLKQRGLRFLIIDSHQRVGDAWRMRWDSCRLFTPACYNSLPGLPFPYSARSFPTKDEMADYLEGYAVRLELPMQLGVRVESLWRDQDRYVLRGQERTYVADSIVVAVGSSACTPPFAAHLDSQIRQIHSSEYGRPDQLRSGDVLVVGAGNSGADIALELAGSGRGTWLSGSISSIPVSPQSLYWYWWFLHHRAVVDTRAWPLIKGAVQWFQGNFIDSGHASVGLRLGRGGPRPSRNRLIRVRLSDLRRAGVNMVGRTCGVTEGLPRLDDGRLLRVANVVWCTGFKPTYSRWIRLPVFKADGQPDHVRGVGKGVPGLYFVGRPFQRSMTSDLIADMSKHTSYVISHLSDQLHRKLLTISEH